MSIEVIMSSPALVCLADYTAADLILPALQGEDVAGVVQELCQVLKKGDRVIDSLPFYHAAMVREYLVSTVAGPGIAFPHARIHGLPQACFALGRSREPIRWGSSEWTSVRLVFLSAVPATDAADYLRLLSGLTRLSKQQALVEQLHEAKSADEMLAVLKQGQLRETPARLSDLRI